jgi:hypothetical protein
MHLPISRVFLAACFLLSIFLGGPATAYNAGQNTPMSPNLECTTAESYQSRVTSKQSRTERQTQQAQKSENQHDVGGGLGGEPTQNQSLETQAQTSPSETSNAHKDISPPYKWWYSDAGQQAQGDHMPYTRDTPKEHYARKNTDKLFTSGGGATAGLFGASSTYVASIGGSTGNYTGGGGAAAGGGSRATHGPPFSWFTDPQDPQGNRGDTTTNAGETLATMQAAEAAHAFYTHPEMGRHNHQSSTSASQGSRGSSAGEDSQVQSQTAFESYIDYLINVANEEAGAACSSRAVSKTYANVVWMVQQMYKQCYIPMAILLLLPGAIITQVKVFTHTGFFVEPRMPDPDLASPFIGIARAMVAIFLIPATQLAVSYCIDIGNSLEDVCQPYVSLPLIEMWCQEQIQVLDPNQQGNPVQNIPNIPQAPYRGKFAGMPVGGAILEQMSDMDIALMELVNECYHMLSMGMCVISGFQLVMMCYLFLLGPLAAAFFAWPQVGRTLFRQAFSVWLDAVVVLSLWKFWWNVTLVCMTVRLESGGVDPYNPFEVYYLIAFFAILLVMPFNPFDFHGSALVGFIEGKAAGVVGKVAQGGKSQGGKNSGKSHGKMAK